MIEFLSGYIFALCLVTTIFFARFWRKTDDSFFAIFSLSFLMLGLERLLILMWGSSNEISPKVYLIRLTAFILILLGIVIKNKGSSIR